MSNSALEDRELPFWSWPRLSFLGATQTEKTHETDDAVRAIVSIIGVRQAALSMKERDKGQAVATRMDQSIRRILDDFCGTRWPPSPFPKPDPRLLVLAAQLGTVAHTLQPGRCVTKSWRSPGRSCNESNQYTGSARKQGQMNRRVDAGPN